MAVATQPVTARAVPVPYHELLYGASGQRSLYGVSCPQFEVTRAATSVLYFDGSGAVVVRGVLVRIASRVASRTALSHHSKFGFLPFDTAAPLSL